MRIFAWILGFIFIILLLLLLILGGGKKSSNQRTGPVVLPLPEYSSSDATVSLTIDGHINGDDAHRQIRITVGRDQRLLEIIQGYQGNVISSQTFTNNQAAYDNFLRAINLRGFSVKRSKAPANNDYRGQCPEENRYIFKLDKENQDLINLWTSDCSDTLGTFGGNVSSVIDLFRQQITGYNDLTSEVQL